MHIVLAKDVLADAEAKARVYERIREAASSLHGVNQQRFERYGVLSGWLDAAEVPRIREVLGVVSVDADSPKVAINVAR